MTFFDTSIPGFGEPSAETTEEMRTAFFTISNQSTLSHKVRCKLHELISCGIRPTDYTLEEIAIGMIRPNEESLSHFLYVLGELTEPIDLSIFDMKLLHDDPGIEMFTTSSSSNDSD